MKIEAISGRVVITGRCTVRDALLAVAERHRKAVEVHQRVAVVSPRDKRSAMAKAEAALRLGKLYLTAAKGARGGSLAVRETLDTPDSPRIG